MQQNSFTPTVQSYSSAAPFLERIEPLLLAQEARYGLMLGITLTVLRQPDSYGQIPPYFAIATDNAEETNGVAAAACMTPPYGIIVYSERADSQLALRAIAQKLVDEGWSLPTVNGPEPICTYFAQIWSEITGVTSKVAVSERVFELRQVIHPTYSPGKMRQAILDDLDLVTQWFVEFTLEALPAEVEKTSFDEARPGVQRRIERGALYVWEDGEAVSMAGTTRPTANGIAIGPVYTPPRFRGKGYASSCVAQLSQRMLDQGRAFCTLFTDLANPTSNSIYQKIGYRPVCDYTVYSFKSEQE